MTVEGATSPGGRSPARGLYRMEVLKMETMAKMEFSRRELELLISATVETIGRYHEIIRKNADWPEMCREYRKAISELEYLLSDLNRAREDILPMACPA